MSHPEQITRRPATVDDTEWARLVHHEAERAVVERQFGTWDEQAQDRFFANDWNGGEFEVLEWAGERCGYVCVEVRPGDVHIRELVIAPSFQRRGIGTSVISAAIDLARERRVPVVLGTLHQNEAAVLYRRLGFIETGRSDTHILFRLDP